MWCRLRGFGGQGSRSMHVALKSGFESEPHTPGAMGKGPPTDLAFGSFKTPGTSCCSPDPQKWHPCGTMKRFRNDFKQTFGSSLGTRRRNWRMTNSHKGTCGGSSEPLSTTGRALWRKTKNKNDQVNDNCSSATTTATMTTTRTTSPTMTTTITTAVTPNVSKSNRCWLQDDRSSSEIALRAAVAVGVPAAPACIVCCLLHTYCHQYGCCNSKSMCYRCYTATTVIVVEASVAS